MATSLTPDNGECCWCGVWKILHYLIEPGAVCAPCMDTIRVEHPHGEGNWY